MSKALVLFRDDFRLADHPALNAACHGDREVVCLYTFETGTEVRPLGGAVKWWLHGAIKDLRDTLRNRGGDLLVAAGDPAEIVPKLVRHLEIRDVYANARYEDAARRADASLRDQLGACDAQLHLYHANVLHPPESVKTQSGQPFKVFSAFWRAFQEMAPVAPPLTTPKHIHFAHGATVPHGIALFEIDTLLPKKPNWAESIARIWTPGEEAAHARLTHFISNDLDGYAAQRNFPDRDATSRLSPYLRFGHISPRQIFLAVEKKHGRGAWRFQSELGWRDFATGNLVNNPQMPSDNLRDQFDRMAWLHDPDNLHRWQQGQTGVPIVDAGMRQLWQTGWMHNRVRMITGSFLTKHLLTRWQDGEAWFWDTLVDADLASNAMNWQWVAGTGIDAAPYFRVFNPVLQGEKFDRDGAYVRQFVPELSRLPSAYIHHPWDAPGDVLERAGLKLGQNYPRPCVDLKEGRARALEAFKNL